MLEFRQIPVRNLGNVSLYQFIINQGHRLVRQREDLIDHLNNLDEKNNQKPKQNQMLIMFKHRRDVRPIRAVEKKFAFVCICFFFTLFTFVIPKILKQKVLILETQLWTGSHWDVSTDLMFSLEMLALGNYRKHQNCEGNYFQSMRNWTQSCLTKNSTPTKQFFQDSLNLNQDGVLTTGLKTAPTTI